MTTLYALCSAFRASKGAQWVVFGALALIAILGFYVWAVSQNRRAVEEGFQAGQQQERAEAQSETLNSVRKANDAAEAVRNDPVVRRDGCLRHSRTPENC